MFAPRVPYGYKGYKVHISVDVHSCRQVQVAVKCPVLLICIRSVFTLFVYVQFLPYYFTLINRLVNFDYFCWHTFTYCLSVKHFKLDYSQCYRQVEWDYRHLKATWTASVHTAYAKNNMLKMIFVSLSLPKINAQDIETRNW